MFPQPPFYQVQPSYPQLTSGQPAISPHQLPPAGGYVQAVLYQPAGGLQIIPHQFSNPQMYSLDQNVLRGNRISQHSPNHAVVQTHQPLHCDKRGTPLSVSHTDLTASEQGQTLSTSQTELHFFSTQEEQELNMSNGQCLAAQPGLTSQTSQSKATFSRKRATTGDAGRTTKSTAVTWKLSKRLQKGRLSGWGRMETHVETTALPD